MKKNFFIKLSGKNGIFRSENDLTLFSQHLTVEKVDDYMKAIRAEIKKMSKYDYVTIDLGAETSFSEYTAEWSNRLIVQKYDLVCEVRPVTVLGDFSDTIEHTFDTEQKRLNYVINFIKSVVYEANDNNIPTEESDYQRTL